MRKLLIVFIALSLNSCSLDNKTGIWKDASEISVDNRILKSIPQNSTATRYENISTQNKIFNEEIDPVKSSNFKIDEAIKIINWPEQYALPNNNVSNFSYSGNRILLSKSSRLNNFSSSKNNLSKKIIFYKNNLIFHDNKGTIFIYSLELNKKIFKYNFYKKNFKNIDKKIDLIVNGDILYAADNLGYLYALNLKNKSIKWAKNYGIPFRSNLKLVNNQIFLANQDNVIYSINSDTGKKNWQFATSLTFLKSDFRNNFALDLINNNLFFLNTSGELYSINYQTQNINWVLNFKNASLAGDTELFLSHPLALKGNNLIVSTEKSLLSYNILTAERNWILPSEPIFKPVITSNYTYTILKNGLIISVENISGKVFWSKNIFTYIINNDIRKFGNIIDLKIVNGEINIYSSNGYLLALNHKSGKFISITKFSKSGIASEVFYLNNNIVLINSKSRLLRFN